MNDETKIEPTEPAPEASTEVVPTTEAAPAEAKAETKPTPEREDNGKFRKPVQPRIDELTRKARENEREAQYWRARAEAKEAAEAKPAPVKPTPEKFTDYNDYVEALADFKAQEKVDASLKAHDSRAAEAAKQAAFAQSWNERVAAAKAKYTDFDAVMGSSDVGITQHVRDVINDSDVGPELAYHLAQHPDVAARLNAMTPLGAAREAGRIEAQLAKAPEPEAEPEAEPTETPARPKTSAAPPPAKPIASGRATPIDLSKASMEDYVKARKAQGARWAR